MSSTIKTLINDTQDSTNVPRSATIVGSTDQTARAFLALFHRLGNDLLRRHDWRQLVSQQAVSTTATETQTDFFPVGFKRLCDGSMWNRTRLVRMIGPVTSGEYQALKVRTVTSIYPVWRHSAAIRDIQILPAPDAGETIAYDCVLGTWVALAAGGDADRVDSDEDMVYYDDDLMVTGLSWMFLRSKGLDYADLKAEWERILRERIAQDGARSSVQLGAAPVYDIDVPIPVIPDRIIV